MALKMLLLFYQEFGAAFQEVTKNLVLETDLWQKLNFGIQKTAHTNFAKITSVKKFTHTTGYHSLVDASVICESLFKDRKSELSLFGNAFHWELVSSGNDSVNLYFKSVGWFPCDSAFW